MKKSYLALPISFILCLLVFIYIPETNNNNLNEGETSSKTTDALESVVVINKLVSDKPSNAYSTNILTFPLMTNPYLGFPPKSDFAFIPSVMRTSDTSVLIMWFIHPETYLYKDKINISVPNNDAIVDKIVFSESTTENDPFFGDIEVYRSVAKADVTFKGPIEDSVVIDLSFQGCWDGDICYPPSQASVSLLKGM